MDIKTKLLAAYRRMQQMQLELHGVLSSVPSESPNMKIEDAVDAGFMCREVAKIMEDLRKALQNKQQIIARTLAMRASAEALNGRELKLEGEYARARPDSTTRPKLPDRNTPEWFELMRFLGCSEEQIVADMLRPSWKEIQARLEALLSEGRENDIPGVVAQHTDVTVIFRTKNRKEKENDEF